MDENVRKAPVCVVCGEPTRPHRAYCSARCANLEDAEEWTRQTLQALTPTRSAFVAPIMPTFARVEG